MSRRVLTVVFFAAIAAAAEAQQRNPADYVRVLLPVHRSFSTPTGVWFAQWWFRNEGEQAADVFPLARVGGLPPPPGPEGPQIFILARPSLGPRETPRFPSSDALPTPMIPPAVPVESDVPGAFVYVERARAQQVAIGGVLQWIPRAANAVDTPLRAIPEREFVAGERNVIGVPVISGRRYALRIYALPETLTGSSAVRVRVYEMQAPSTFGREGLLLDQMVELRIPQSRFRPCGTPCDLPRVGYVPAVAEMFNIAAAPSFGPSTIRVEIAPESTQVRWWAIVSATDNSTNSVALFEVAPR